MEGEEILFEIKIRACYTSYKCFGLFIILLETEFWKVKGEKEG